MQSITLKATLPLSKQHGLQGGEWADVAEFYQTMYGLSSLQESAARTSACIRQQPPDQPLIVIAHNAPEGLGATPESPAGMDFVCGHDGGELASQLWAALSKQQLQLHAAKVYMQYMLKTAGWQLYKCRIQLHAVWLAGLL